MVILSNLGAENNNKLLTDYNQKILTFYSIYDYFVLLKVFNTNTLNFHQYFKDKLYSHQPSHMHNTRHSSNSNFNIPLFNHSVGKGWSAVRSFWQYSWYFIDFYSFYNKYNVHFIFFCIIFYSLLFLTCIKVGGDLNGVVC